MKRRSDTSILQRLNKWKKGSVEFSLATDSVVGGLELGPVKKSKMVSVSQVGSVNPPQNLLMTGRKIAIGHNESLKKGQLRCFKDEDRVCVAVFAGRRITSRVLTARAKPPFLDDLDEGLFTWFGPVEYIGTPWSDNDPYVCQVVTINHLRAWARG